MKTNYILITPVLDEGDFIVETIKSVVCRSILPKK